jgi:hypothetical protein
MIRYTVVWDPDVESQFISDWIDASSSVRAMLTEIANWMDTMLAEDPDRKGVVRDDLAARVLTVAAANSSARVAVTYRVFRDDRLVRIVRLVIHGG